MSGNIIGTRNGLILDAPLSLITLICSDNVMMPPIPLVIITETLFSLLSSIVN